MTEGATVATEAAEFEWPELVPWSRLGPEFVTAWAPPPARGKKFEGEHIEATGQTGSGKSYALGTILHERALKRDTGIVYICTKAGDQTVSRLLELGWPVATTVDQARQYRQCVFWPETKLLGEDRERFFEARIWDLLTTIMQPGADTIVVFDEIGYVEALPGPPGRRNRLRKLIRQLWREARAWGVSVVASKQRPVGVVRDQHSESRWKIVFAPADEGDMDRFAELLGRPRDWAPVLRSLDQEAHQFVIRHNFTKIAYITWIDFDVSKLRKLEVAEEHRTPATYGGKR